MFIRFSSIHMIDGKSAPLYKHALHSTHYTQYYIRTPLWARRKTVKIFRFRLYTLWIWIDWMLVFVLCIAQHCMWNVVYIIMSVCLSIFSTTIVYSMLSICTLMVTSKTVFQYTGSTRTLLTYSILYYHHIYRKKEKPNRIITIYTNTYAKRKFFQFLNLAILHSHYVNGRFE